MRTNIVIDDALMDAAMKAGGFKTKKDAVEEGLRLVARRAAYQNLRALRGKLNWSEGGDWSAGAHAVQESPPSWGPERRVTVLSTGDAPSTPFKAPVKNTKARGR